MNNINRMKYFLCNLFIVLIIFGSNAQRYEVWVETAENHNKVNGNYGFSNDSVLMLFTNSSLLFPSKDKYFTWDDVEHLKYRNKSKNQLGLLLGAGAGLLAFELLKNSTKNSADREAIEFTSIITLPIFVGTGALTGHLATKRKTDLPVHGLPAQEKDNVLKSKLKKKRK